MVIIARGLTYVAKERDLFVILLFWHLDLITNKTRQTSSPAKREKKDMKNSIFLIKTILPVTIKHLMSKLFLVWEIVWARKKSELDMLPPSKAQVSLHVYLYLSCKMGHKND